VFAGRKGRERNAVEWIVDGAQTRYAIADDDGGEERVFVVVMDREVNDKCRRQGACK